MSFGTAVLGIDIGTANDQPASGALDPAARDQALANAPKRDDEYYRVPAVLGD